MVYVLSGTGGHCAPPSSGEHRTHVQHPDRSRDRRAVAPDHPHALDHPWPEPIRVLPPPGRRPGAAAHPVAGLPAGLAPGRPPSLARTPAPLEAPRPRPPAAGGAHGALPPPRTLRGPPPRLPASCAAPQRWPARVLSGAGWRSCWPATSAATVSSPARPRPARTTTALPTRP